MAVLLAAFEVLCFSAVANSNNASPTPEAVAANSLVATDYIMLRIDR